jgi:glycosyltransferase involved in cell wall biosynthesis
MAFSRAVLQVVPALDSGGAERSAVEIAAAIVEAGGRALVASSGGRLAGEIVAAGGRVIPMPVHSKNPLTMHANVRRLAALIAAESVDIIHVRSRAPAWSALLAARRTKTPLVATYHGAYEAKGPLKRFYNSAMARADRVIANSQFTADSIAAQYPNAASRIRVICRGADLKAFDPDVVSPTRAETLARSWGLGGRAEAFNLLLPARLTFWKGQDIAVQALGRLAAASGQRGVLRLVLAGDAEGRGYGEALRRKIDGSGVRDMVHLVGHCADMPAAYAWADAVLSPATLPEAFGRVAVEAGAMARPVIAADHGGARETVVNGETGFLVPPGDARALADAIEAMRNLGPRGREAMGRRARAWIKSRFSADTMRRATLAVYSELSPS